MSQTEPHAFPRHAALTLLRVVVPVALLALLWHLADGPAVMARLLRMEARWILAALLAAHVQVVLMALRWQLVAARLGQVLSTRRVIGEYYLAQLVNQTLPGGMIGDAARAVRARGAADMLRSGQAVVIERLAGQLALLLVTVCGLVLTLALPGGVDWPLSVIEAPILVLLAVLATLLLVAGLRRMSRRVRRITGGFSGALWQSVLAPGVRLRHLMLGLAIVGCNLATFAFCAAATGSRLPFEAVVTLVPLVLFAMVVPITIGGWGLREGAAAALLPFAGATAEGGIAASVAFGLVILLSCLPGLVWMLLPPHMTGTEGRR